MRFTEPGGSEHYLFNAHVVPIIPRACKRDQSFVQCCLMISAYKSKTQSKDDAIPKTLAQWWRSSPGGRHVEDKFRDSAHEQV